MKTNLVLAFLFSMEGMEKMPTKESVQMPFCRCSHDSQKMLRQNKAKKVA